MRKVLFIVFLLLTSLSYSIDIDSLKSVISSQKSVTNKVNSLNALGKELRIDFPIEATKHANLAFHLSDSLNYIYGKVIASRILGDVQWYQNNYPKSFEYYLQALNDIEQFLATTPTKRGYRLAAELSNDVAMFYKTEDEHNKAVEFLNKGMEHVKLANAPEILADYLFGFAVLYNDIGKTDSALAYYNKSLEISIEQNDLPSISKCYNNMASIYNDIGRFDEALPYFKKAYEIDSIRGYKRGLARLTLNIGGTNYFMGNEEKGLKIIYKGIEMAKAIGRRKLLKTVYMHVSGMHEQRGEYQKALELYKLHTALKDSLFNESKSKEIGKLEAQYEMEKKLEEEKREEESLKQQEQERKSRRDNLQFSGIFVFVLLLFAIVFMSGKFAMSERVAEGLIFFTFLLFFEFCLVLLDPLIDSLSSGEPLYKLLFNAILAGAIFPLHAFFENTLKKRILKK